LIQRTLFPILEVAEAHSLSSGFRIETLDRSGRWYLSPGTRSIYDLRVRNETREATDCLLRVEDPPSGVRVDPSSCVLRGSEVRTVTVILEGDAPVARSQRVVIALCNAGGEELARFEHPVVITGGSDCSLTLALDDVLWEEDEPHGVVVSCTVRSQSEGPTSFALGVTPHPSLRVAPIEPLALEPGETGRVLIPVRWDRTVKDEQGRNHPPTLEIGVAVSNGRRTGRIRWDLIEEKLRSAERQSRQPRREEREENASATPAAAPSAAAATPSPARNEAQPAAQGGTASPVNQPAGVSAAGQDGATADSAPGLPERGTASVAAATNGTPDTPGTPPAAEPVSARSVPGSQDASQPVRAVAAAASIGQEPCSNGAPAAEAHATRHEAPASTHEAYGPAPSLAKQNFDLKCLPNPDAPTAVASGAAGSATTASNSSIRPLAPTMSALAGSSENVVTSATVAGDLEAALTARPSDFAKSVRISRMSGDIPAAGPRRLPAGIGIVALAVITIAAGALLFRSAPARQPAVSPPTTSLSEITTATTRPAANELAGAATAPVAVPAPKVSATGDGRAAKPSAAALHRALTRVATPRPTATQPAATPVPTRAPTPVVRNVAAAAVRPARAAPPVHQVVRPALDEPPPGPVVALGGIDAYYGPRGHVVRVFWSAAQQVSAVVQLLSVSGRVISATRVRGHRQQALLYLPRWFHGPLTVMVSSVGRMGERVAQTTSLPPFGH
jgi:hypothetical protein